MSSARVKAQNKVLEIIGVTKKSTNVQFNGVHHSFLVFEEKFHSVENALLGFNSALKGFHLASSLLCGALCELCDEAIGPISQESKDFFKSYCNGIIHLDTVIPQKYADIHSKTVEQNMHKIRQSLDVLHENISLFNDSRAKFDHYTRKTITLRENRDKRSQRGKVASPKKIEKLSRNEAKLAEATRGYNDVSEKTVGFLRQFCDSRMDYINPLLTEVIQFRVDYSLDIAEEAKSLQVLLQRSNKREVPKERDTEVITSSFKDFVSVKANNFTDISHDTPSVTISSTCTPSHIPQTDQCNHEWNGIKMVPLDPHSALKKENEIAKATPPFAIPIQQHQHQHQHQQSNGPISPFAAATSPSFAAATSPSFVAATSPSFAAAMSPSFAATTSPFADATQRFGDEIVHEHYSIHDAASSFNPFESQPAPPPTSPSAAMFHYHQTNPNTNEFNQTMQNPKKYSRSEFPLNW